MGSSFIAREWLRYPALVAMAPSEIKAKMVKRRLWINMARSTSRARSAAEAEAAARATALAAKWIAALVVSLHSEDGTDDPEADRVLKAAASMPDGSARPRRISL
jgi:hypothetical protein